LVSQSRPDHLKGLKALVAFLGVLVVLGTAVVVGVVIKRLYASPAPPSTSAPALTPSAAGVTGLPAGSRIEGIAGAGNVIAIWTSGPQGGEVYLLDPQTGRLNLAVTAPP